MKRLLLTCTDLMAIQFLVPHVKYLSAHDFSVELACSDVGGRLDELCTALDGIAPVHVVRLVRSPFSPGNRKGFGDLKKIIDGSRWDVIWTNEPVMGVMTRMAAKKARKSGTKVEKRKELGVPENAFFVVSVGELKDHKNHEVMIRALEKAHDPKIVYGICGKGELLEPLQKLAHKLGIARQILFFGYRRDIQEILHTADLFAFPSKRDGLGLAALEAMACGLPLLTSDIRGISDYVENGVTGFRYQTEDINGFTEGLKRYSDDIELCRRIGEANRNVVARYDIHVINEAVYRLMDLEG